MAIQTINLGNAPSGAGGDTFRSTGAKMNENFTNWNHAASRQVGTVNGNVMEVGAFGLGKSLATVTANINLSTSNLPAGFYSGMNWADAPFPNNANTWGYLIQQNLASVGAGGYELQILADTGGSIWQRVKVAGTAQSWLKFWTSKNTTVDSNGFIKAASPIIKLFADKIESNEEASEQNPVFEKIDVGHYLVKDTDGFAQEGWWIEVPTDSNGNRICAIEYQTLENGDLEIKTFKKKLNDEGDIVANLDAPIDIPNNANGEPRWIDVRLHSVPKPTNPRVPKTEKQARMVQQVKYAPQLTYITKYEDLFDDAGNPVIVDGQKYQKPVTHIQTDKNGTPILSNQPVINDKGEPVFEWVQAIDSEGQPIFDDVPVLDADGNQIYDEVTYEPQQ